MDYFILEIPWVSHITISTSYGFTIIKSSVIKQFNIPVLVWPYSTLHEEFIYLLNIYLLNNKQGLKAHFNKTWRYPNSKILFYNDYRHDLIMNFLLNFTK